MTDAELAALYDRYAHVLYARCFRIMGNEEDAHDAVQETFAKVLRHSDSFRQQSSPLTWMYRISTNHCLNLLRNRRGRSEKLRVRPHDAAPTGPEPDAESSADLHRVRQLLDGVDEQTRQCVIYTFFDDCTRQQTAQLVGLSVPTVRKRINTFLTHARRALAAVLMVLTFSGSFL